MKRDRKSRHRVFGVELNGGNVQQDKYLKYVNGKFRSLSSCEYDGLDWESASYYKEFTTLKSLIKFIRSHGKDYSFHFSVAYFKNGEYRNRFLGSVGT